MTAVPEEETGRYGCPACPLRFWSLSEKKHHLRAEHPRPKKKNERGEVSLPGLFLIVFGTLLLVLCLMTGEVQW